MTDVNGKIREYMRARGWTEYRIAIESGLSQSTVANLFRRNTVPSIATLDSICGGLGITLAQFFAEGRFVELTEEQQDMFSKWATLSAKQKRAIAELIEALNEG